MPEPANKNERKKIYVSGLFGKTNYPISNRTIYGTISGSYYLNRSIIYLDNVRKNLESVVSDNPFLSEAISPVIYRIEETKNILVHDFEKLLSTKKSELDEYEKLVRDYEKLINNPEIEEDEIQCFFEKYYIIINPNIKEIFTKKSFGGEGFPDFIAILHNEKYIVIEIEKPTKKLYTETGYPSSDFIKAEQQIQDYLRWANEEKEYLRKRGLPNISVENTGGLLIIGMSKNLSPEEKKKFERKKFECGNYEIKTFDEILSENQQLIDSLRKKYPQP